MNMSLLFSNALGILMQGDYSTQVGERKTVYFNDGSSARTTYSFPQKMIQKYHYEDKFFVAQLIFIDQSVTQAVERHKVSE